MIFGRRITASQLATLCRRIGESLEAGLDILRILDREANHGPAILRQKMRAIRQAVGRGASLADAIEQQGNYFPKQFRLMVDVGEKTGRLDLVLLKLADYYEQLSGIKWMILVVAWWPALQLIVAILVVGLVILLPSWLLDQDVDILGFGLIGTQGLIVYGLIVATVFALLVGLLAAFRRGFFVGPLTAVAVRLPGVGLAFRTLAQLRFTRSLSLAIAAGMDAWNAVGLAFQSAQNPYFVRHADACRSEVRRGTEIHTALQKTKVFDQALIDAIKVGEETGKLAESLETHANQLERRLEITLNSAAIAAAIGIWICVGLLIIFMIFRLAMFYLSILNDVMNGF